MATNDPMTVVASLRQAVPYLRLYQNRTFVVKVGGAIFDEDGATMAFMEQVAVLHQLGIRVVLVHGGGPQIGRLAESMGVPTRKVAGRRVTNDATLRAAIMTLSGDLRTRLLALAVKNGVKGAGLSGVDGGMIRASKRPVVKVDGEDVDFGLVGDVVKVDVALIDALLAEGYLPIVSPLGVDDNGQVLNINADVVAAHLTRELDAQKLVIVSGVPGLLDNPDDAASLVSYTDVKDLNARVEGGSIEGGMRAKVTAIKDALYGGVPRVHLISYRVQDALLQEVFTNVGSGTLVVLDTAELMPSELMPKSRSEQILDGRAELAGS